MRAGSRPPGQLRQSQVITTFGPGAMVDLPNHSVLVGGLDYWTGQGEEIIEPRLRVREFRAGIVAVRSLDDQPDRFRGVVLHRFAADDTEEVAKIFQHGST